jgi:multiple sugar transport system substrate-binding protein
MVLDQRAGRVRAGGQIIEDADQGANAKPSMAVPAGDAAADIIGQLARSPAAPSDISHRGGGRGPLGVPERRRLLHGQLAYVYNAALGWSVGRRPSTSRWWTTFGWARYPEVAAGEQSAPPSVASTWRPATSPTPEEASPAAKCITSLPSTHPVNDRVR